MISIVKQLEAWVADNREKFESKGIKLTDRLPDPGSNIPWKASIGLEYKSILVSYTVWERTGFQTELLVLNALSKKTVVMEDASPEDLLIVPSDLDNVVKNLLNGMYMEIQPDS